MVAYENVSRVVLVVAEAAVATAAAATSGILSSSSSATSKIPPPLPHYPRCRVCSELLLAFQHGGGTFWGIDRAGLFCRLKR